MRYISIAMIAAILIGGWFVYQGNQKREAATLACFTAADKNGELQNAQVKDYAYSYETSTATVSGVFTIGDSRTNKPYTCIVKFDSNGTPRAKVNMP